MCVMCVFVVDVCVNMCDWGDARILVDVYVVGLCVCICV